MAWDFDRCVSVFSQEIALIKKIILVENSVHKAVMARAWADFDWRMAEINQLGQEFNRLEAERVELLAAMEKELRPSLPDAKIESSFYTLITRLPPGERRLLSGLFRELKIETLRMKAQNETFTGYLNEIKTITSSWMEAIFPAQGGKLYTRKGRQATGGIRSVVFNRHI